MDQRLIPAHAGKTKKRPRLMASKRAHPRSRGENSTPRPASRWTTGSSPLTRGKPRRTPTRGRTRGLIPAHAGKTLGYPVEGGPRRAHPRSRGENCRFCACRARLNGSSPLTRGKHRRTQRHCLGRGLIPAHAGKTIGLRPFSVGHRAHPRSRGENRRYGGGRCGRRGSSPLTRGKLSGWIGVMVPVGLIPAHAGKTEGVPVVLDLQGAHPRSRGENGSGVGRLAIDEGSSPLTRGKLIRGGRRKGKHGLIPAHAGKTNACLGNDESPGAHPRSRGENSK